MPMICTAVPLLTFCVVYFGRLPLSNYGTLAMGLMNWQPCLNPFFSLYFVKPFRVGLHRLFRAPATISTVSEAITKAKDLNRPVTLAVCNNIQTSMPPVN